MFARRVLLFLVLATVFACGGQADLRDGETWIVDFQSYADQVNDTVSYLDLDLFLLEDLTLEYLREFYEDLPIEFELGVNGGNRTKSSICVRHSDDGNVGRGAVDVNNDRVNHDCGEPNGQPRGAFINRLADIFAPQVAVGGYSRRERTDLFAHLLALVLAHEIGHGLGLGHSDGIMAPFPDFDIHCVHQFSPVQLALLRANLPR